MKHPQRDQEGDQNRTNDVISIQTAHGSILSCCGGSKKRKRGALAAAVTSAPIYL
jgi:hypothetical protein